MKVGDRLLSGRLNRTKNGFCLKGQFDFETDCETAQVFMRYRNEGIPFNEIVKKLSTDWIKSHSSTRSSRFTNLRSFSHKIGLSTYASLQSSTFCNPFIIFG
jgi:hypothetical protein